jgi:hypothetical protein
MDSDMNESRYQSSSGLNNIGTEATGNAVARATVVFSARNPCANPARVIVARPNNKTKKQWRRSSVFYLETFPPSPLFPPDFGTFAKIRPKT